MQEKDGEEEQGRWKEEEREGDSSSSSPQSPGSGNTESESREQKNHFESECSQKHQDVQQQSQQDTNPATHGNVIWIRADRDYIN